MPHGAAREPDLTSLINIVFLILIFFIVAGTLRPFSAKDVELAKVRSETAAPVPSSLIVHKDGRVTLGGQVMQVADIATALATGERSGGQRPFTIVADGRAPGSRVLEASRALQSAGFKEISIMVERGRK